MADLFKPLMQSAPAAGALTDAYIVPAGVSATVSSFVVCNRAPTSTTFRIAVAVAGAADDGKQYLYYDAAIPGNRTLVVTLGGTLAQTDVVRVSSANGSVSFNGFGVEVS
jgi:hypothetical protein